MQAPDDALGVGFDPRKRPWYEAAQKAIGVVLTEFYLSNNGHLVTTAAKGIRANNELLGVVGIDINLDAVSKFLNTLKFGDTVQLFLTEDTGLILYSSARSDMVLKNIQEVGEPGLTKAFSQNTASSEVEYDDTTCVAVSNVTKGGWHLILLIHRSELLDHAMHTVWTMVYTGIALVMAVTLLGLLISRSIVRPLQQLGLAAQAVADGNFDAMPRDDSFKGELKNLHADILREE